VADLRLMTSRYPSLNAFNNSEGSLPSSTDNAWEMVAIDGTESDASALRAQLRSLSCGCCGVRRRIVGIRTRTAGANVVRLEKSD
jgi:hypothetical protein